MPHLTRAHLFLLLRLFATIALLLWVSTHISLEYWQQNWRKTEWRWLVCALLLQFASNALAGWRSGWLVSGVVSTTPPRFIYNNITLFFAGSLINQGLPSTLGGDAFRVWQGQKILPLDRFTWLIVVLTDRLMGAFALLSCGVAALLIVTPTNSWGWFLVMMLFFLFICAVLFLRTTPFTKLTYILRWLRLTKALPLLQTLTQIFIRRSLFLLFCFSLVVHAFAFLSLAMCFFAFGLYYPLSHIFLAIAAAVIVALLPISISGWGVRETAMLATLSLLGHNDPAIINTSIAYGLITLLASIPGVPVLLKNRT